MIDLISLEKSFILPHVKKGGVAADFTMGNGHDTLWLSNAVGEEGKVYAFDVQKQALDNTSALLEKEAGHKNWELILDSHANSLEYIKEKLCVGVFNLGYLPGSDKKITTMRESTLKAVRNAVSLLDDDGIVLIAVYPGHAEGALEGEMLTEELSSLERKIYCVGSFRILNSPTSPFVIFVEKK